VCAKFIYFLFIFMVLYQIMTHSGIKRVKHDLLNFKFKISVLNALENPPFIK
jgi:hypothetical protein